MAMDWLFVFSLLLLFFAVSTLSLPLDSRDIKEVTGVFIYPQPPQDIFNASAAKDACRSQNAALATKAQMERALQHGLETSKYGWIDEQIAVLPRRLAHDQWSLVVWNTPLNYTLAAFCFKASDLKQTHDHMTTDSVLSLTSKSTTTLPAQVHASTAVTPPVSTKMKPPASIPSTAPPGWKLAPVTATSPPTLASKPPTAATSSSISPTSPSASSTTAPPLLSLSPLTSISARFSSSSSLTSTSLSPFTPSPTPPVSRNHIRGSRVLTVSSADTSLGGVPRALIALAVGLILQALCGTSNLLVFAI